MELSNSVEHRIFEKLRYKNSNDFRDIPEDKRTKFDKEAIKLIESFEFITVPATKKERSIKTLFLNKYSKIQKFIEIAKIANNDDDRNLIVFKCGDEFLTIYHNYFLEKLEHYNIYQNAAHDLFAGGLISSPPYQRTTPMYQIIGKYNKTFNKFEDVESYLVDFVVEYTRNFKLKKKVPYYH